MTGARLRLLTAWRGGDALGRPGWWFAVAYDEDGVAALKAAVPATERTWSDARSAWWVADSAIDAAITVVPALAGFKAQGRLLL